ncbi:MAG: hypothetical protein R3C56_18290 [Pirellulaceae bacterium]
MRAGRGWPCHVGLRDTSGSTGQGLGYSPRAGSPADKVIFIEMHMQTNSTGAQNSRDMFHWDQLATTNAPPFSLA